MRLMRNQGLALEPSDPEGGGRSRTNVLVSVWISTSCPNSHQLFKRCASHLSSIPIDRARERRAAACEHRLFLIRRRHSSAVEQLFRNELPCSGARNIVRRNSSPRTDRTIRPPT